LDYVLFLFTICFLNNFIAALKEVHRVLTSRGSVVIGFIPQHSEWGDLYSKKKTEGHIFYRHANFYAIQDVERLLNTTGFTVTDYIATLSQAPDEVMRIETPSHQVNQHGFVCIKAQKM
jgi:hypothetical protein